MVDTFNLLILLTYLIMRCREFSNP